MAIPFPITGKLSLTTAPPFATRERPAASAPIAIVHGPVNGLPDPSVAVNVWEIVEVDTVVGVGFDISVTPAPCVTIVAPVLPRLDVLHITLYGLLTFHGVRKLIPDDTARVV